MRGERGDEMLNEGLVRTEDYDEGERQGRKNPTTQRSAFRNCHFKSAIALSCSYIPSGSGQNVHT